MASSSFEARPCAAPSMAQSEADVGSAVVPSRRTSKTRASLPCELVVRREVAERSLLFRGGRRLRQRRAGTRPPRPSGPVGRRGPCRGPLPGKSLSAATSIAARKKRAAAAGSRFAMAMRPRTLASSASGTSMPPARRRFPPPERGQARRRFLLAEHRSDAGSRRCPSGFRPPPAPPARRRTGSRHRRDAPSGCGTAAVGRPGGPAASSSTRAPDRSPAASAQAARCRCTELSFGFSRTARSRSSPARANSPRSV